MKLIDDPFYLVCYLPKGYFELSINVGKKCRYFISGQNENFTPEMLSLTTSTGEIYIRKY
jgi:hypothetical protein